MRRWVGAEEQKQSMQCIIDETMPKLGNVESHYPGEVAPGI